MSSIHTTLARELGLTCGAGRGRYRPCRRGQHHPVHRPLPQGGHRRHGRRPAAHLRRAPRLPAQPRGPQGRGAARHRRAGQAHARAAREDRGGRGHAARGGPVQAVQERSAPPARRRRRDAGLEPLALLILAQGRSDKSPLALAAGLRERRGRLPHAGGGAAGRAGHRGRGHRRRRRAHRGPARATRCAPARWPWRRSIRRRRPSTRRTTTSPSRSRAVPGHRVLAVNRGEKEGKFCAATGARGRGRRHRAAGSAAWSGTATSPYAAPCCARPWPRTAIKRLVEPPALDREMRALLTETRRSRRHQGVREEHREHC